MKFCSAHSLTLSTRRICPNIILLAKNNFLQVQKLVRLEFFISAISQMRIHKTSKSKNKSNGSGLQTRAATRTWKEQKLRYEIKEVIILEINLFHENSSSEKKKWNWSWSSLRWTRKTNYFMFTTWLRSSCLFVWL